MPIARALMNWKLAFGAILLFANSPTAQAAEPKASVASIFTKETVGFLHVRIADVWESPGFAFYRKMIASLGGDEIKAFDSKFTPNPTQIESLTVILPTPKPRIAIPDGRPSGQSLLFVLVSKQPIEREALLKALGIDTRVKSHRGGDYFFDESHWAGIIQIDPKTLVIGSEDSIVRLIEQQAEAKGIDGPLAKIFAQEAGKHSALLAVNPATLSDIEFRREIPKDLLPLMKATIGWAALDLKQETQLTFTGEFATPEQTTAGKKALEDFRKLAFELIAQGMKETQENELGATKRPMMGPIDMPAFFTPMVAKAALKYLEATLKKLMIESNENTLRTSLNLTEFFPYHGDVIAIMSFAAFIDYAEGGRYYANGYGSNYGEDVPYFIRGNFDTISAALQAYHQDKGSYPPVATYDKDGKPLLSWRVLILPYLEKRGRIDRWQRPPFQPNQKPALVQTYADLYKRFKLDEPWDSMHNKQLLEQMPTAYNLDFTMQNWRVRTDWKTGVQVFTGPGSMFPGKEGVNKGQVRDGLETTIAVAFRNDVTSAVPWSKPADLPFAANKPVPKLFGLPPNFRGGRDFPTPDVYVLMGDGQSRRFPPSFDEKAFRGLVTIDGGESVKLPEPRKEFQPKFK